MISRAADRGAALRRTHLCALWLAACAIPLWLIATGGLGDTEFRDFSSQWVAGRMVLAGQADGVYDIPALRAFGREVLGADAPLNFTYPPQALLVVAPLAALPLKFAFWAWNGLTAVLFFLAARPLLPARFPAVLALVTPAALLNLLYGQYGLLVGALWFIAFRPSGVAAAALTLKPQIGGLALFAMLRAPRQLWRAAVSAAALAVVSTAAFGAGRWPEFLTHLVTFQAAPLADGSAVSWLFAAVTPLVGYGWWGWLCFATAGGVLLARRFNVFTAATATFLIAPYGFHYDMTVAALGFIVMLTARWAELSPAERALLALAFASPGLAWIGTWLVPPMLLAGLWVQSRFEQPIGRQRNPSPA